MIYLLITKLLREMSQSGMCFYLFLQWMSTDFRNLHDAPGALHRTLCQYVLCRRPKAWPPFRSKELLLVHFALFVCPPLIFMSYCRFSMYYPGMYYFKNTVNLFIHIARIPIGDSPRVNPNILKCLLHSPVAKGYRLVVIASRAMVCKTPTYYLILYPLAYARGCMILRSHILILLLLFLLIFHHIHS